MRYSTYVRKRIARDAVREFKSNGMKYHVIVMSELLVIAVLAVTLTFTLARLRHEKAETHEQVIIAHEHKYMRDGNILAYGAKSGRHMCDTENSPGFRKIKPPQGAGAKED